MGLTLARLVGWTGASLAVGFAARAALLGGVDDQGVLLAVGGAAALLAYAALDRDELTALARQRAVRLGWGSALLTLSAGLVAVLGYTLVASVDRTFDLTQDRRHGLTSQTLAVLAGLERDVEVLGFFPDGSALQTRFAAMARQYAERGPRVTVELVDPGRQPLRARELDVQFDAGEVVVRSGERVERLVGRFDEDALTDAIVRASTDRDTVICWTEGHGEADPDDTQTLAGMGSFVALLESQSWRVQPFSLATGVLPEGCDVMALMNPRSAVLAYEQATLSTWLLSGGRVLLLLEPGGSPGLAGWLATLGLTVGDDLVLDPDPAHRPMGVEDPSVIVLPPRAQRGHPITDDLLGAVTVGLARSVVPVDRPPGVAAKVLLRAGPESWAETRLGAGSGTYAPDADEVVGDVPLGVALEVVAPSELSTPGPTVPEVSALEVEQALRSVLRAAGPQLGEADGTARLRTDLGLTEADQRLVLRTLARTLGVELPPLDDPTLDELVDRVLGGLAQRLPPASAEAPTRAVQPGGRLVVFGDAGFAANRAVLLGSNRDLLENSLAWLVGEEDRLGARPDALGDVLDLTSRDEALVALVALVLAPGLALAGAWAARRRQRGR